MGRNWSHFGSDLVHAGNAFIAVLEDRVFHWTGKCFSGPTKQCRIKISGFFRVVRSELVPAKTADVAIDIAAGITFVLPNCESGAGRILNDGHATRFGYVEWSFHHGGARGCGLSRCVISIFNGNVAEQCAGIWCSSISLVNW